MGGAHPSLTHRSPIAHPSLTHRSSIAHPSLTHRSSIACGPLERPRAGVGRAGGRSQVLGAGGAGGRCAPPGRQRGKRAAVMGDRVRPGAADHFTEPFTPGGQLPSRAAAQRRVPRAGAPHSACLGGGLGEGWGLRPETLCRTGDVACR
eukprot:1882801-Prymnesium_polylepis.1